MCSCAGGERALSECRCILLFFYVLGLSQISVLDSSASSLIDDSDSSSLSGAAAAAVHSAVTAGLADRQWMLQYLDPTLPLQASGGSPVSAASSVPVSPKAVFPHPLPSGFVRDKVVRLLRSLQRLSDAMGAVRPSLESHAAVYWALRIVDQDVRAPIGTVGYVDAGRGVELTTCAAVVVDALVLRCFATPGAAIADDALAASLLEGELAVLVDVLNHPSVEARAAAALALKRGLRAVASGFKASAPGRVTLTGEFSSLRGYAAVCVC